MSDATPPAALEDADRLRELVADGPLLAATDFDGTLAEIVEDPGEAAPRPDARDALARLVELPATRVAAVSGRGLADLRERVGLDDVAYAGNHGLEIEVGDSRRVHPSAEDARDALEAALDEVDAACGGIDGYRLEDKALTATVHFRQVDDPDDVARIEAAVGDAVDGREALALHRAKEALELRPAVDWDKGRAVDWLHEELTGGDATPLYVGDDTTDEDAFRAVRDEGVAVRVGEGETAAEWRVPDPAAVAELLAWIAELRERTE